MLISDGQGFRGYLVPWDNARAPKDITDLRMVYPFVHRYGRTTSITGGKLNLPSVPSVPMDKVFEGYLVPWYNVKAPKDITDIPMVYTFVHRYGRTTSIYRRQIGFTIGTSG